MRQIRISLALGVMLMAAAAQTPRKNGAQVTLGQAIHHEEAEGNITAAIGAYRKAISQAGGNRALAAKAMIGLGRCYEKQGNNEARKTYESVLKQYADQTEAATQARARLSAIGAPDRAGEVRMRRLQIGEELGPSSVTADGRFLAAQNWDTGNAAIIDLTTGKNVIVTNYGSWDIKKGYLDSPVISRDGKHVAFWHYKYSATDGTLRVVGADGKNERVLYATSHRTKSDIEWGVANDWSPDGSRLVVQLERGNNTAGVTDFVLLPVSGGPPTVLKTAEFTRRIRPRISFSPDGKYLAYDYPQRKDLAQNDIQILPVTGGQEVVIAPHSAQDTFFGWTPGGDILFTSNRAGEPALYRVRISNGRQAGEPELLKAAVGGLRPIGVTQSGALYYSQFHTAIDAYTMDVDFAAAKLASQPKPVSDRQNSTLDAVWSADKNHLAWLVRHPSLGRPSIMIRDERNGVERELIPQAGARVAALTWGKDGNHFLAGVTKEGKRGLYRLDARTAELAPVYESESLFQSWSEDWVFYAGGAGNRSVIRRNIPTGEEKVLYTCEGNATPTFISVSPDRAHVAFGQRPGEPDGRKMIMVVPFEGGPATTFYSVGDIGLPSMSMATAWTPDSKQILVQARVDQATPNSHFELWLFPVAGGSPRKLDYTNKNAIDRFAIHPGGRRLSFTVNGNRSEFWTIENLLSQSR